MLNCREDMIRSPCLQSHIYARNWAPKRWKFHGNSFNFPLKSPFSSGSSYLLEAVWICMNLFWILCGGTADVWPSNLKGIPLFSAVVAGWWGECITLHDTQCPLNLAIWSRRFGFVLATKQVTHAAQVWSLCSALNMMNFTFLHCVEGKILKKPQSQLSAPRNFCRIHADLGQLQLTSSTKPGSQGSCGHLPQGLPCWRYLDSQKSNIVKLPSRCVAYSCWAVFLFRVQID